MLDPVNPERVRRIREELEKEFRKPVSREEIQKAAPGAPIRSDAVIELTRLNKTRITLNCELIEIMEETPDTVITMLTGRKYIVTESMEDIRAQVVDFKRKFHIPESN